MPREFADHVQLASGTPSDIVELARNQGYQHLYIDGGNTVQRFRREDLIDEMIITEIPILIGGGERLFGELDRHLGFELVGTEVLLGQLVKKRYRRKRG